VEKTLDSYRQIILFLALKVFISQRVEGRQGSGIYTIEYGTASQIRDQVRPRLLSIMNRGWAWINPLAQSVHREAERRKSIISYPHCNSPNIEAPQCKETALYSEGQPPESPSGSYTSELMVPDPLYPGNRPVVRAWTSEVCDREI